ncbi:MAG: FadR/GntR family transcriptional regulator, partial [Woeseiaceae bacterium]
LADREFHLAIAAASRNGAVKFIVETLWKMRSEIDSVRSVHAAICAEEDAPGRGAEHADILKALKDRDSVAARDAMQTHFNRLLASMIDITEEQALRELQEKASKSRQRFLANGSSN